MNLEQMHKKILDADVSGVSIVTPLPKGGSFIKKILTEYLHEA